MTITLRGVPVFFDWNGTVVVDAERAREALNLVLDEHGLTAVPETGFPTAFSLPLGRMFGRLGVAHPELVAAERSWNEHMARLPAPLRPGVRQALDALRAAGARTGILSAAARSAVEADLRSHDLIDGWDVVLADSADKRAELAARREDAHWAVYVGDTEYDLECAAAAGWTPIGVNGGYCTRARLLRAGAVRIVDDLRELVPTLLDLQPAA